MCIYVHTISKGRYNSNDSCKYYNCPSAHTTPYCLMQLQLGVIFCTVYSITGTGRIVRKKSTVYKQLCQSRCRQH